MERFSMTTDGALFTPIMREKRPAKILLTGPAGSGKTRTAMEMMRAFASKVAVAQTEPSAELYAELIDDVEFRSYQMDKLTSSRWIEVMEGAVKEGFDGIILDSLSDEWRSTLQMVDSTMTKDGRQDSRAGWRAVRPEHDAMFQTIIRLPIHVIATCRAKMQYDWESNQKRALGYEPQQDNDLPYFFDMVIDMQEQTGTVSKVRGYTDAIGLTEHYPGREFIMPFAQWLKDGAEPTIGESALQRLRAEFPAMEDEKIRAAVRAAGVTKRADIYRPGWYEKAVIELTKPQQSEGENGT